MKDFIYKVTTTVFLTLLLSCLSQNQGSITLEASPNAQIPTIASNLVQWTKTIFAAYAHETVSGSPTALSVKVYALYASENQNCTNAIQIASIDGGVTVDFYQNPTIFTTEELDGDYQCIILEIDDQLTFKVNAQAANTFGGCELGTSYTNQWYLDGGGSDGLWKDPAGQSIDGTDGIDRIFMFASTDKDAAIEGPMAVFPNQISKLSETLPLPSNLTFYGDFNNGVSGDDDECEVEIGKFGFRS